MNNMHVFKSAGQLWDTSLQPRTSTYTDLTAASGETDGGHVKGLHVRPCDSLSSGGAMGGGQKFDKLRKSQSAELFGTTRFSRFSYSESHK